MRGFYGRAPAIDPRVQRENDVIYHTIKAGQMDDELLAIYWNEFNDRTARKHGERVAAKEKQNG